MSSMEKYPATLLLLSKELQKNAKKDENALVASKIFLHNLTKPDHCSIKYSETRRCISIYILTFSAEFMQNSFLFQT